MATKTITLKDFKEICLNELMSLPDDTELFFGSGDLSFYRLKNRDSDGSLVQIEFNEIYQITSE